MFRPIQEAAVAALKLGPEWYAELNGHYRERRVIAQRIMDTLGCSYDAGQVGLFVWAKCPNNKTGYEVSDEALYNHDVFITPGGIFGGNGEAYVRISLCSTKETLEVALGRLSQ